MSEEFDALMRNDTWDLVPKTHQNMVGCRWVFRIKRNPDGTVAKCKARLIAKGYHQHSCLDYKKTFSPISKLTTIRLVLSLALASD